MKKEDLKKLLIGFFLVMLLLTVLSRAAASMTVPTVTAQTAMEGMLTYKIYGTGVVEEEKTRPVLVLPGLLVEEIFAETGKQVKEGEALFSYSMESIETALEDKEAEYKKLELSYRQEGIGALGEDDAEEGTMISLRQAEAALEQAKADLKEGKRQIKKEAKEELKALEKEYEDLSDGWEEKKLLAEQAAEDAKTAYEEQKQTKDKVEGLLLSYQQAVEREESLEKWNDRQKLIKLYFGSQYPNYQNKKSRAIKAVINAEEDIRDIRNKWKQIIREEDKNSEDQDVADNYISQCEARNSEIKAAERILESAEADLAELMEEENALAEAMDRYERKENGSYQELYELFVEKLSIDESAIAKAKKGWERALESQRRQEEQAEKEFSELLEKQEKAEEKVEAMKEGTYDYEEELQEKRYAVENAEYALEQAEHNVKSAGNDAKQAAESRKLRLEALSIDMEKKKQELEELETLKKNKGNVMSPADGTVAEQQLETGIAATGQERVLLAADMYCLRAEVEAESCRYFQVGDEIAILKDGASETFIISGISTEEKDGMRSLTVELPEEGYPLGSSFGFKAEKNSASFSQKVPIQSLRRDNSGYYVLVVSERAGILGTEQYLSRIGVEFLEKDDNYAAISGSLGREDKIVVSGSRNVESGDRVRLMEE